jgi:hypothetical protein
MAIASCHSEARTDRRDRTLARKNALAFTMNKRLKVYEHDRSNLLSYIDDVEQLQGQK